MKREQWTSRLGIIFAVAGSAVGLGNFLRFPVQVTQNGGGAFLIPYFISFLLLGIPLCWIEWTMGRYGGKFSHGSAPGIFNVMVKSPLAKYLGAIGLFGPLVIFFYYVYVESWLLAYGVFSLFGKYAAIQSPAEMKSFLSAFQGLEVNGHFSGMGLAYMFFLFTFLINFYIIYRGVVKGIELISKIAMPVLVLLGVFLAVRIIFLKNQVPDHPEWNILNGFGFMWNPDWKELLNAKIWLAAAGQIFFTLSVGIGVILTYASYLHKKEDVVLSSLTASSTNEFFEVIIGGSIIIPATFVFFGPVIARQIAQSGSFNLSFVTMPLIFKQLPLGSVFGFCWFMLLFLAGITSSISILQPAISYLEDVLHWSKRKAVLLLGLVCFLYSQTAVFFIGKGIVDELDFWGGTFLLVLFGALEAIIFGWIYGIDRAWKEMHNGADIRVPVFFKFIIKYITPTLLIVILGYWTYQQVLPTLLMKNVPEENKIYILGIRILLFILFTGILFLIKAGWNRRSSLRSKSSSGR